MTLVLSQDLFAQKLEGGRMYILSSVSIKNFF